MGSKSPKLKGLRDFDGRSLFSQFNTVGVGGASTKSKGLSINTMFNLKEEIEKLEENPRRELQIIGYYLSERRPDLRSKEQLQVAIRRHLRAAKSLTHFDDDQIVNGFKKAKRQTEEWVLETVQKNLTK